MTVTWCWSSGPSFNDEHLYAVQATDGRVLWKFKSEGGPFDASVALADLDGDKSLEIVAADSSTGTLFCLNAAGQVVWKKKLPNSTDSPPSVADLDGDGAPEIAVAGGRMHLFDLEGRELWKTENYGSIPRGAAAADVDGDGLQELLFGASDRRFRAVDGKTGHELWAFDATTKGHVYESLDSGPVVADFDQNGTLEVFFIAGKGTSDESRPENYGRAIALSLGKGSDQWPMFRGNLRRTGVQ